MDQPAGGGGGLDLSLLPYDGVQDLIDADPDVIGEFTSNYLKWADEAEQAAKTLRGDGGVTWTGAAAEAFRQNVSDVPHQLHGIHVSYLAAGQAMAQYGPATASAQRQIVALLGELEEAKAAKDQAASAASQAASAARQAADAAANPPSGQTPAQAKAASAASSQASDTSGAAARTSSGADQHFASLQAQGQKILEQWTGDRQTAAGALHDAGSHAPQQGWFSSVLHGFVDGLEDVGRFAWTVIKGIGDTFVHAADIFAATVNVIEHPGSLKAWERFGRDALAAGTVVLMATGVGDALAGASEIAEAGLEGAAEDTAEGTLEDTATTTLTQQVLSRQGLKYAVQAGTYGQQAGGLTEDAAEGNWGKFGTDLSMDAAGDVTASVLDDGTIAGGRGKIFGGDDEGLLNRADGSYQATTEGNALKQYANSLASGKSAAGSLASLSSDEKSALLTAAGTDSSATAAQKLAALRGFDPTTMTQGAANSYLGHNLAHVATSALADKATETGADQGKDALGHAVGVSDGGS